MKIGPGGDAEEAPPGKDYPPLWARATSRPVRRAELMAEFDAVLDPLCCSSPTRLHLVQSAVDVQQQRESVARRALPLQMPFRDGLPDLSADNQWRLEQRLELLDGVDLEHQANGILLTEIYLASFCSSRMKVSTIGCGLWASTAVDPKILHHPALMWAARVHKHQSFAMSKHRLLTSVESSCVGSCLLPCLAVCVYHASAKYRETSSYPAVYVLNAFQCFAEKHRFGATAAFGKRVAERLMASPGDLEGNLDICRRLAGLAVSDRPDGHIARRVYDHVRQIDQRSRER